MRWGSVSMGWGKGWDGGVGYGGGGGKREEG